MSEQAECRIDLAKDGRQATIRNLTINDLDVVNYVKNAKPGKRCDALLQALRIGAIASRSSATESDLRYVQDSFERLSDRIKSELDSVFDPETGRMSSLLQDRLDKNDSAISEMLDPNREDTPLSQLRKHLDEELRNIQVTLVANAAADKATKETARKGTQKGREFEDWCEDILAEMAKVLADKMERTGDVSGSTSTGKQGDFVITVNGLELGRNKIVFEMKSGESGISRNKIEADVQAALENRQAQYCIYVSKYKEAIPDDMGWFNEYDGKYLVCALENTDPESDMILEDDISEPISDTILQIAYKWARTRLQMSAMQNNTVDNALVIDNINSIQLKIQRLDDISKNCNGIRRANEKNIELAGSIKDEINSEIDIILDKIK